MVNSYKNLHVWQKAMNLCEDIYLITKEFPRFEIYGLTSQIRRCSVSIPSNIAEGSSRGSNAEYKKFLRIAFASAAELETQLTLTNRLDYLKEKAFKNLIIKLEEIMKMLNNLNKSLTV